MPCEPRESNLPCQVQRLVQLTTLHSTGFIMFCEGHLEAAVLLCGIANLPVTGWYHRELQSKLSSLFRRH